MGADAKSFLGRVRNKAATIVGFDDWEQFAFAKNSYSGDFRRGITIGIGAAMAEFEKEKASPKP